MKVRECNTTYADQASAAAFFMAASQLWDLNTMTALDMFARNGQLTVTKYVYKVKTLDLWELSEEHRESLERFGPCELKIGCSYKWMRESQKKFGMIVIDTPQGVHHDYAGMDRYEHFNVLEGLDKLMEDTCLVVLYVNLRPYDKAELGSHGYDQYDEYDFNDWMKARMRFYGTCTPRTLTEEEAVAGYRAHFLKLGYSIEQVLLVPCFSDVEGYKPYAFRLGLSVKKLT